MRLQVDIIITTSIDPDKLTEVQDDLQEKLVSFIEGELGSGLVDDINFEYGSPI